MNFRVIFNLFVFVSFCFEIFLTVFMLSCLSLLCSCVLLRLSSCISCFNGLAGFALFVICFISFVSIFQVVLHSFYVLWVVFVFFGCLVGVKLPEAFELCFRFFQVVSRIVSICCSCSGCLRLFLLFEIFKSRARFVNILV